MSTKDQLFVNATHTATEQRNKITIIGSGSVATAAALSILLRGISNDIVIIGRNEERIQGEVLDLQGGWMNFVKNVNISGSNNVSKSTGSRLIIFTASEKRREGESQLDSLQKNVNILTKLVPKLVQCSPEAVWLIVSRPSDVLAFITWKVSGLPKSRIIGCGTCLESTRFRFLLAQKLNLSPSTVHAWIIGKEGASSIPLWSSINIAGIKLRDINPSVGLVDDEENWLNVHQDAVDCDSNIEKLKGKQCWGIATTCADIAYDVINSTNEVRTVSTLVKGLHKITAEVFMSLPCQINASGIANILNVTISQEERSKLLSSANLMEEVQKSLNF